MKDEHSETSWQNTPYTILHEFNLRWSSLSDAIPLNAILRRPDAEIDDSECMDFERDGGVRKDICRVDVFSPFVLSPRKIVNGMQEAMLADEIDRENRLRLRVLIVN